MNSLEVFYETLYKIRSHPRKETIKYARTLVIAPPQCGKTYFVLDYLNTHFKSTQYLYVNLEDLRFLSEELSTDNLQTFITQNNIKALALDNYSHNQNIDITHLEVEHIILTSTEAMDLASFKILYLNPLDFEQFLVFGNYSDSTHAFNAFLRCGNFPISMTLEEHKQIPYLQNFLMQYSKDETTLFIKRLVLNQIGQERSILELFKSTKRYIKISKDKFYTYIAELEKKHFIYFLRHYLKPKAAKKVYAYNPVLFNAVSFNKKFQYTLNNFIFLELKFRFESIYFVEGIDFYLPNEHLAIICMPFVTDYLLASKSQKILKAWDDLDLHKIQIITNSMNDSIFIEDIECEVIPFYDWALCF
jgi:predicted AAA+ superfamily ATPase